MPYKLQYWRTHDRALAEQKRRRRRLQALGLTRSQQLSPAAAAHYSEYKKKWLREHKKNARAANQRYRDKLKRLYGNSGKIGVWQYKMHMEAVRAKKRKTLLSTTDFSVDSAHSRAGVLSHERRAGVYFMLRPLETYGCFPNAHRWNLRLHLHR